MTPPLPIEDSRTPRQLRVLVVDDHPVLRRGLVDTVNAEADMTVCGEAGTIASALDAVASAQPDVAVVDLFNNISIQVGTYQPYSMSVIGQGDSKGTSHQPSSQDHNICHDLTCHYLPDMGRHSLRLWLM